MIFRWAGPFWWLVKSQLVNLVKKAASACFRMSSHVLDIPSYKSQHRQGRRYLFSPNSLASYPPYVHIICTDECTVAQGRYNFHSHFTPNLSFPWVLFLNSWSVSAVSAYYSMWEWVADLLWVALAYGGQAFCSLSVSALLEYRHKSRLQKYLLIIWNKVFYAVIIINANWRQNQTFLN
jgi:hypothetical protein